MRQLSHLEDPEIATASQPWFRPLGSTGELPRPFVLRAIREGIAKGVETGLVRLLLLPELRVGWNLPAPKGRGS